jgi:hypothetical protein
VPVLQTQKDAWSIQQNFLLFLWIGALYARTIWIPIEC